MPQRQRQLGSDDGNLQVRQITALLLTTMLAGCVTTDGPGSVAGGECKVFDAPRYAIRGATQHDQDWIDPTIESGVGGCHWKRPAARPMEWDRQQVTVAAVKPAKSQKVEKKRGWFWKALPTLARKKSAPVATPIEVQQPPTLPPAAPELAPTPPPARSALDILLRPSVQ